MDSATQRLCYVLLSVQRALLDAVPPALRGVRVEWTEGSIDLYSYFDGPVSEAHEDLMASVATEVLADFPGDEVRAHVLRIDAPAALPRLLTWAYRRAE